GLTHDPLPIFRRLLHEAGVLDDAAEADVSAVVRAAVEDATAYAENQPDPDPSTAYDHVFADPSANEPPPPWHPTARDGVDGEGAG
ncbi:MAG TPA: thiamine pyrophosphate-dependent enzyme, partial [Candidatus Limnocylindrales bacterium]